ncbi:MAG: M1 family metallopeptidase [Vicingaceae bacterium]
MKTLFLFTSLFVGILASAQYWQQQVKYEMNIAMDVQHHTFTGYQRIEYTNNSPDTLRIVFYHLYYNAFQPGSMMDARSKNIIDPDRRIGGRISELADDEIGYHRIKKLKQDGSELHSHEFGTILKVFLNKPLPPGGQTVLEMDFESQVPKQIRRTGRDNIEGIEYSMSQWYPKLVEYDQDGWNAIPYIAREYHGVWGDFNVKITIDSAYTLAGTGILQNANEIGKGYSVQTQKNQSDKRTWHFRAENVHDFVWAADPDYLHSSKVTDGGVTLHFFYQNDTAIIRNWEALPEYAARCFDLMEKMVGKYPYSSYSIIQAGDGGMEYPMATLILGNGKLPGLIGVTVHESIHSWFQGVLANNEGKYPWMDEGFNTYYDNLVMDSLFGIKDLFPQEGNYRSYFKLVEKGLYEPLSTHSDHFKTNRAYGVAAYSMGCILLNQLGYIVGQEVLHHSIKHYYEDWQFRHPEPRDFKRIVERESGIQLDWYFNYFIQTTKKVDYSVESIQKNGKTSTVLLKNNGDFPLPVDLKITTVDGRVYLYNIPLRMMYGNKENDMGIPFIQCAEWKWTDPEYSLNVDIPRKEIAVIEFDPLKRTMDLVRRNNVYPRQKEE